MPDNNNEFGSWNEHAIMVLAELKRLNQRLDLIENQLEDKLDRAMGTVKGDHKDLAENVHRLEIEVAVLKREVALKTAGIAFFVSLFISGVITIVAAFLN